MAKIKCPGCGAEIDTDSGQAEFVPPADPAPVDDRSIPTDETIQIDRAELLRGQKPSRFWRGK